MNYLMFPSGDGFHLEKLHKVCKKKGYSTLRKVSTADVCRCVRDIFETTVPDISLSAWNLFE